MLVAVLIAMTFAGSVRASDLQSTTTVTGAWSGALLYKVDGESHEETVHAVLKHNGPALTGTAGPDADRQYRINNGKVTTVKDTTAVAFDVIVSGVHMSFDLKLADGALKGTANVEGEDGRPHVAAVELKPVK